MVNVVSILWPQLKKKLFRLRGGEDIVLCRVCNEITESSPLNGGDDGARSTSLFNNCCVYCNILQCCLSLASGHYLTVLVAIDIRQVVNGTTIHVSEMARQLAGGGVSVTGQGRYGGSRFVRLSAVAFEYFVVVFVVVVLERWLSQPGFIEFILTVQ